MNRIHLLPEQVANQIAAGEVIERPASVVKELVENSLDAHAERISVEIQSGGRSLIRVSDDGVGMSRDDALLCLERHATSKIRRAEDLAAIDTMGFRGEALPSIASVSRFTLTTRERDDTSPEGTQVIINGGKILTVKAAGCAPGTSLEVRQLFFNLPARRKFLRTDETETAHIQHYLVLAALACPSVAFTFQRDGRLIWQLPSVATGLDTAGRLKALRERLRALYGNEQHLLDVEFAGRLDDESPEEEVVEGLPLQTNEVRVWGVIGAPGVSRATREDQHLFVNRRPIENRSLNYALLEGYHTTLMKGRYPVCCLFLEMAPAAVDVNIHPAKREVKFHQEHLVRRFLMQAVRQALLKFGTPAQTATRAETMSPPLTAAISSQPQAANSAKPEQNQGDPAQLPKSFALEPPKPSPSASQPVLPMGFIQKPASSPQNPFVQGVHSPGNKGTEAATTDTQASGQMAVTPRTSPKAEPIPLLTVPLRLVGVVGNLYVLLESDRGLVLLDQHAAHERILFEQMLARLENEGPAPSQHLLLPQTVELSPRDAAFLRQQLPVLGRLGVGLSEFGERTFLLDALPPYVKAPDPRRFVLALIDELKATGQEVNTLRLGEHIVAKTVCRHAVKAHDPLNGPELEKLVEDLRHCAMPYTCPHGRPTMIEMNFRELEKKFGRIV